MTTIEKQDIVERLDENAIMAVFRSLGVTTFKTAGRENWLVCSPMRDDAHPSLSIRRHDGVWNDKGTEEAGDIFEAVMRVRHCAFPEALEYVAPFVGAGSFRASPIIHDIKPNGARRGRVTATYDYVNEDGALLYQVLRYDPKGFSQRRPNGTGGWILSLGDVRRVPYRLPAIRAAASHRQILICEGEKDADRIAMDLGVVATTNAGGSKGWTAALNHYFIDRHVVILPDNDRPGREYAQTVATALSGIAASIKIVTLPGLPEKGDVSDWLDQGGTVDDLKALVSSAPAWEPRTPVDAPTVANDTPERELIVVSMDDVQSVPVDWLWHRWLARGKLHLLGGHQGDGKSTLEAEIASTLSTGGTWPDGTPAPVGNVLFLLAEDALDDTLKPRLELHGANMRRIHAITAVRRRDGRESMFNLHDHLDLLEDTIMQHRIDYVVIDPLSSFMPRTDRNGEDVRDILTPLSQLAERCDVSIKGVMHMGKPGNGGTRRGMQMFLGATAFTAVARIVWAVAPVEHDDDEHRRGLGVVKTNLAMKPTTLQWTRSENGPIRWLGESTTDIEELLSGGGVTRERSPERERILTYLRDAASPLKPGDIADALGMPHGSVKNSLRKMLDDGAVTQPSYGHYSAVTLESDDSDDSDDSQRPELLQQTLESSESSESSDIRVTCPYCGGDEVTPNIANRLLCRDCYKFVEDRSAA